MISEHKNNVKKLRFTKTLLRMVHQSRIIGLLMRLTDFLCKKAAVSFFAMIMSGYAAADEKYKKSFFYSIFQGYKENQIKKFLWNLKKMFIQKCEDSIVIRSIGTLADKFLFLPLRRVGLFLLSFGFYTSIVYFLKIYIFKVEDVFMLDIWTAAVCVLTAVILLFCNQTVYAAIYESKMMGNLFFRLFDFGEKNSRHKSDLHPLAFFITGMALGILTFAVMPIYMIGLFIVSAIVYIVLCKPETGGYLIIIILPFLPHGSSPSIIMSCMVIFTGISFFIKVARGKRAFSFGLLDLLILVFILIMLLSGLFSVGGTGSLKPALIYCCFISVYFILKNMLLTRKQIFKAVNCFIFSGVTVSLYGVYQNYFGIIDSRWQDASMFADISGRVISTFENPNVLAEYLLLLIPFTMALLFLAEGTKQRVITGGTFIVSGLCLVFTWSRGSWIGFLFAAAIFLMFIHRNVVIAYVGVAMIMPFSAFFIPQRIVARFASIGNLGDSSTSYRVSIWKASINMIKDYFWTGIGVGTESFKVVYQNYSLAGIESAPHSHSLYFQTIIESGIFGLIVLLLIAFFFVQSCASSIPRLNDDKKLKLIICAGLCGILGYFLNGFTDYIWYNYRVFLMFWIVISIISAANNFALRKPDVRNSLAFDQD